MGLKQYVLAALAVGSWSLGGCSSSDSSHSAVAPPTPSGVGVAGSMDGTWTVTSVTLQSSPVPVGNPTAPIDVGVEIVIADDAVVTIDGVAAGQPNLQDLSGLPFSTDFFVNQSASDILTYCLGVSFGSSLFIVSAKVQIGLVGGTLTANTALANIMSLINVSGLGLGGIPTINESGMWEGELQRVP